TASGATASRIEVRRPRPRRYQRGSRRPASAPYTPAAAAAAATPTATPSRTFAARAGPRSGHAASSTCAAPASGATTSGADPSTLHGERRGPPISNASLRLATASAPVARNSPAAIQCSGEKADRSAASATAPSFGASSRTLVRILVTVRFAIARAHYGFVDRPPLYRAPARVQEEGRNCGQCQRNSCTSRRPALSKTREPGSGPAPGPTVRSSVA